MIICGIDIGTKGGIAFHDGTNIAAAPMPYNSKTKEVGYKDIQELFEFYKPKKICIEKVHAMPNQGRTSMFNFGKHYGSLLAISNLYGEVTLVDPRAWQRRVLGSTTKDKSKAIEYIQTNYPDTPLIPKKCKVPQSGLADAACIAEYLYKETIK